MPSIGAQAVRSRFSVPAPPEGGAALPARLPSARRFLAVFAAIALCFIGATAYSQYLQRSIDRAALDIADNAAPSILHLAQARTDLRHVQILLHEALSAGSTRRDALAAVGVQRDHFRADIDAYLVLPTFPGERDLWQRLGDDIRGLDLEIDRAVIRLAARDPQGAAAILEGPLSRAADRAEEAIALSLEFDAAHARRLAQSVNASRSRAAFVEQALDGAIAVLAVAAGGLLFRAVRHYEVALEESSRLAEQRAEELERFADRVAHDILSPLGAASMAFALIDGAVNDGGKAKVNAARGQRNVQRVQRIVNGLLELARAGARPTPSARAEVGPIIEDVVGEVRLVAAEAGIEVSVAPFPPCVVACNEGALTSLVSNLLRNAVKYMGDRSPRRVTVTVIDRGAAVRIEVADTGPGIAEELQAGIFEPYVRGSGERAPGLGLGLATVKRIVVVHGGAVGVRSSPGCGSVFWFELPKPAPIGATPGGVDVEAPVA